MIKNFINEQGFAHTTPSILFLKDEFKDQKI